MLKCVDKEKKQTYFFRFFNAASCEFVSEVNSHDAQITKLSTKLFLNCRYDETIRSLETLQQ